MNPILEETQYVAENAQYVSINKDKISSLPIYDKYIPAWENDIHYNDGTERTLWYLLVLDTLNFCFWNAPQKKWCVQFRGKEYSGYRALAASLTRAMEERFPINNAHYLRGMPQSDLEHILSGEGELLLMDKRVKALHELGKILIEKHKGDFLHVLEESGFDAQSLSFIMAKDFPSFRDVHPYKGRLIPILKRAQIIAADIYGAFGGKSYGALRGMGNLTAFADYKLPQLLHAHGVLNYEKTLENKIHNNREILAGSEEEIEIRAATIHAVEMIKQEFTKRGRALHSYQIDWILWTTAKELSLAHHHCTRTIFY